MLAGLPGPGGPATEVGSNDIAGAMGSGGEQKRKRKENAGVYFAQIFYLPRMF